MLPHGVFAGMADKSGVQALKNAIQSLWQMENELRYSAWSAFALDKEKARTHLAEARRHLNNLLNEAESTPHTADHPPAVDD